MFRTIDTSRALATAGLALLLGACAEEPTGTKWTEPTVALGNGFPNNGHATLYKMNLIGHPGSPSSDMLNDQGKRIFVRLNGNTRILLSEGSFDILDANGTDGTAAFSLPDPDPDGDGVTWYGVYIRPKGKPNTGLNITTCASGDFDNDPTTPDEELCSLEVKVVVRGTGKPKVDNISRELLTLCVDTDGDLQCDERIFLFDDRAHDYLWSVDNFGLRNAEVRFLEIPQNIGLTP
ncbi:MAG TPA: hypothetical protein VLE53_14370 [Gemmatimonadaceae bacterium]|nr:hypothetical protein [Gemmatimonadaceae bacterium]